jgi:hypothetical protein
MPRGNIANFGSRKAAPFSSRRQPAKQPTKTASAPAAPSSKSWPASWAQAAKRKQP